MREGFRAVRLRLFPEGRCKAYGGCCHLQQMFSLAGGVGMTRKAWLVVGVAVLSFPAALKGQ